MSNHVHDERVRRVAEALERSDLVAGPEHPCAYLPDRQARHVAFALSRPFPGLYHALMDLNFRRSGQIFYRPACDGCDACQAVRIPIDRFRPSRAQRRCWARNADLEVEIGSPTPSDEKLALYQRYLALRHDGQMDGSAEEFREFLCASNVGTIELTYREREGGKLVAVGVADVEPNALSAVYCYFEPELGSRSLGVFNVLRLVEECRQRGCAQLYLGYFVADCARMSYKAAYRPHELLGPDGLWRRHPSAG
jgi:leucyl-tRNA---protein transferase